ncbi:hypothetical protein SRIMM317S_01074 [Streptomyces rimosus subsp. rimosus]
MDDYTLGMTFGLAGKHWAHNHSGQDFVVPSGTAVHAVHGGTVVKAGPNGGGDGPAYGNAIVIKHDSGTYTQYAHLTSTEVKVGQTVETGQEIAKSGQHRQLDRPPPPLRGPYRPEVRPRRRADRLPEGARRRRLIRPAGGA